MVNRPVTVPSVGVIIPNHERCGPLLEAIESVLGQSYPGPVQAYVVYRPRPEFDALVASLSDSIQVLPSIDESGRNSISVKRNLGLAASSEDLVAFLDDDDIWHPNKLIAQVKAFDSGEDVVAVGTRSTYFTKHPEWLVRSDDESFRDRSEHQVISGRYFGTSSLLVDGAVARRLQFDERPEWLALEDYDFKIRLCREGTMRELRGRYTAYRAASSSISFEERRHTLLRALGVLAESAKRDRSRVSQQLVALRLLVVSAFGGFGIVQEFHGSKDPGAEMFLRQILDGRLFGKLDSVAFRMVRLGWRRGWIVRPVRFLVRVIRLTGGRVVRLTRATRQKVSVRR